MPKCEECNSPKGVNRPCGECVCDMCCDICHAMDICEYLDCEVESEDDE